MRVWTWVFIDAQLNNGIDVERQIWLIFAMKIWRNQISILDHEAAMETTIITCFVIRQSIWAP